MVYYIRLHFNHNFSILPLVSLVVWGRMSPQKAGESENTICTINQPCAGTAKRTSKWYRMCVCWVEDLFVLHSPVPSCFRSLSLPLPLWAVIYAHRNKKGTRAHTRRRLPGSCRVYNVLKSDAPHRPDKTHRTPCYVQLMCDPKMYR